jgi:hypothetical protein
MPNNIFPLKYRDTRPIFEVELHDPAPLGSAPGTVGPVHNLTGSTGWKLYIWLADGTTKLSRVMVPDANLLLGILRYTWIATDWGAASSPDGNGAFTVGGLVVGPALPLALGTREHRMEYEVVASTARLTFPNGGYDSLRIITDIGQG